MDIKHINVKSKKYGIEGDLHVSPFSTKLVFDYQGKHVEMVLESGFTAFSDYPARAEDIINNYVERLFSTSQHKVKMYRWYIEGINSHLRLHGVVTGHPNLSDTTSIHTTTIKSMIVDYEENELIVTTKNTEYHCPLAYCRFDKQDNLPTKTAIPDYDNIKSRFENTLQNEQPTIEDGKLLLVISNHDRFYFNSLYYRKEGESERQKYYAMPHIGTFQDSFLIYSDEFDLRYFPHYQNIEFYSEYTEDKPFYIQNVGDCVLYCVTSCGTIKLEPNERKLVSEENAEKEEINLPSGDLYPAVMLTNEAVNIEFVKDEGDKK